MTTVHAGSALASGLALTSLTVQDLWGRYVVLGGSRSRYDLACYLRGEGEWATDEHDIAALAINEYTSRRGMDHPASYSDEI